MSIFPIVIIRVHRAWQRRYSDRSTHPSARAARSASSRPNQSLHQPHALSWRPPPTIAFQYRSVSSCVGEHLERDRLIEGELEAAVQTKEGLSENGKLGV